MTLPPDVAAAWEVEGAHVSRLTSGHINKTLLVTHAQRRLVLQQVNPIFGPEVNEDIEAITSHLQTQGIETPLLVRTVAGDSCYRDEEQTIWRALTFIAGRTIEAADSAQRCAEAGQLLGRVHRALTSCSWQLRHQRLGVHDTPKHLTNLHDALVSHASHRSFETVKPVALAILEAADDLALPGDLPPRLVHGDPKITNVLFDASDGRARCLVDLDTFARMALPLELGDALRSWCAPRGEEVEAPVDIDFFAASLAGYAEGAGDSWLKPDELLAVPRAVELIAVELAARFCADALQESYFGWDAQRYPDATSHNLQRARSQLALARSLRQQAKRLSEISERVATPRH